MNLELKKENLNINKVVAEKTNVIYVEGDIIVPDVKPDILNTIYTEGNVCINKKEVLDGRVRLDGDVKIWVTYLAESNEGNIRGISSNINFTENINCESCKTGMTLNVEPILKSIECKVLNGRKINVKAGIEMNVKVFSNEEISLVKEISNLKNVQMLNKSMLMNSLIGTGNTVVSSKENVNIDNGFNLAEILSTSVKIVDKDIKISYNKVLAKADTEVTIMYLTDENRVQCVSTKIPVMGFIDMPNISDENICDLNYVIKNITVTQNDEHSVYVELEIDISCQVYQNSEVNIIEDLYTPCAECKISGRNITTMSNIMRVDSIYSMRENIELRDLENNHIIDVKVRTEINKTNILNDKINYQGEVEFNFIYGSSNSVAINTKIVKLPLEYTIDINNVNSNTNVSTEIDIANKDFIIKENSIGVNIDFKFSIRTAQYLNMNIIENVEKVDVENQNDTSLIIYFVKSGDTLWKLAKKFRSTVSDISIVNGIQNNDKLDVGQKLFIPRYVESSLCEK